MIIHMLTNTRSVWYIKQTKITKRHNTLQNNQCQWSQGQFTFWIVFRWDQRLKPMAQLRTQSDVEINRSPHVSSLQHTLLTSSAARRWLISLYFFVTRHSLVERRARYLVYCMFVCLFVRQRFLDNPRADSHQSSLAGVLWFRMCLLPFWGLAAPGGRKKGQMKFSLLWESMGNFCVLAVFERYLSNACTDPH